MKAAIIGTGLIGCERIEAINLISKSTNNAISISSVFDANLETLSKVKDKYNVHTANSIEAAMELKPDWVFIATPNDVVKEVLEQAFKINAHICMEKPFGRSLSECQEMIALKPEGCKLYVGFNYRFFAGVEAALHDARSGKFGKLISVNMILGHGNSPGMENSWRFQPAKCGDCTTDLGVHLFDLMLQLSNGKVSIDYAKAWEGFWNTGIQEEAHIIASNQSGTIFNAQVSLNRWKSTFRLEINGTEGYGIVENRGRSYGPQSYRVGKRWGWLSGKSQVETEETIIDKNSCTDSFAKETAAILSLQNILTSTSTPCNYLQAENVMELLQQYRENINK